MSEWWTYRPADLLMFSARSYARLFELYHAAVWPAQLVALALGLWVLGLCWRRTASAHRVALVVLALAWCGVGWAFHLQHYATIQTAAPWFGTAFIAQGVLLGVAAWRPAAAVPRARRIVGLGLFIVALVGQPLWGLLVGRPWTQAEVFGITPDATAAATLAVLLLVPVGWAWVVPLAWVAISATTQWTLGAPDAFVLPLCAAVALTAATVFRTGSSAAPSAAPSPPRR